MGIPSYAQKRTQCSEQHSLVTLSRNRLRGHVPQKDGPSAMLSASGR
jgi:hypothetical protein